MKVGIIGSGLVGKALSAGFIKHGYEVMVGSRTPSKIDDWKDELGKTLQTGTFQDTAKFGEIVIIAVKGTIVKDVLSQAGEDNLAGKTVIDACNPIADLPPVNGVLNFFTDMNKSLMEDLQEQAPKANFVKAFSCVGAGLMVNPDFGSEKPSMFICGNNENAKSQVNQILDKFGWESEDMGMIEAARAIEPMCMLWCIPGFAKNQWGHAFRLLK